MYNMVLWAALSEDGAYRSWETIRLHKRLFLGFGVIAVIGPLIILSLQARKPHTFEPLCKNLPGVRLPTFQSLQKTEMSGP